MRFFYDTSRWVDFYRHIDLSMGTRLHGGIAGVLGGTPSVMIVKDIRMREVAKFHQLTCVEEEDLKNYDTVWDLIADQDFHKPEKAVEKNFENYLDFLHVNGLQTIYDGDPDRLDAPLDAITERQPAVPEPQSCTACGRDEWIRRLILADEFDHKERLDLKQKLKKERTDHRKALTQLRGEKQASLPRKSNKRTVRGNKKGKRIKSRSRRRL